MRVFGKRYTSLDVGSGTDQVIGAFPIPAGGTLRNVWGEVHVIGTSEEPVNQAGLYGLTGFIVRMADPDASTSLQLLWDTQVQKSLQGTGDGDLDIDTLGQDLGPEFEPGEMDISELYRVGNLPMEIFKRRKLLSFANRPLGFRELSGTDQYIPTDHFRVRVRGNYRVEEPSYVLFGFSSPTMNALSSTQPVTLTEEEWIQYTYLQDTLHDAAKFAMGGGLIDVGAESPYDKAALLVEKLLTQNIFEQTSGDFLNTTWQTKSQWTFETSFSGTIEIPVVAAAP